MRKHKYVGQRCKRPDSFSKVTGAAKYTADLIASRNDVLFAKALFPPYAHAKIIRIDTSRAETLEGVIAVMTAKDLPGVNAYGALFPDKPVIAEKEVAYEGDPVALVAAESIQIAEQAITLIQVEYEPLQAYDDPTKLVESGAPLTREHYVVQQKDNIGSTVLVEKGDVEEAFKTADVVVDNYYHTPIVDHAYLEPDVALAEPDLIQGGITIHSPQHAVHLARKALCDVFQIPQSKIHIVSEVVGGAFGGKEDSTLDVSVIAGVLALKTGRPVFYEFTRDEVFKNTGKRHAATIHHRLAANRDGRILGIQVDTIVDKGAYKSMDVIALRTAQFAGGAYAIDAALSRSRSVFTNHAYSCAMRGLGTPQAHFAIESQIDELAAKLHMDPIELRLKNIVRDGKSSIFGHIMLEDRGLGLEECILRVRDAIHWNDPLDNSNPHIRRGKGFACYMFGTGTAFPSDGAHCFVQAQSDGSINVSVSSNELGQGLITVMRQITADAMGVPIDKVYVDFSDSASSPDAGATVASRSTTFAGNAVLDGCKKLRDRLLPIAADLLQCDMNHIEIEDGIVYQQGNRDNYINLSQVINTAQNTQVPTSVVGSWYPPKVFTKEGGQGDKMHTFIFGAQAVVVAVDIETGEITIEDAVLACDVGHAINPETVEGQMQGGMAQGIGMALMEEEFTRNGNITNHTYHDYLIPTTMDLPNLRTIIVEHPNCLGPYGAKGIGEPPLIGAAPAIRNAVRDAIGIGINEIPLTPVRIMDALRKQKCSQSNIG